MAGEPDPLPMFLQASLVPLPTREAKGSQMSIAGCFTYLSFYFWMTIKISSQWKSCCSVLDAVIFPCAFQMQTQVIYSVYRWLHSCPCRLNLALNPQLFPCSLVRTLQNQWQAGGASQLTLNVWGSLVSAWASILCVRQVPYLWSSSYLVCFTGNQAVVMQGEEDFCPDVVFAMSSSCPFVPGSASLSPEDLKETHP